MIDRIGGQKSSPERKELNHMETKPYAGIGTYTRSPLTRVRTSLTAAKKRLAQAQREVAELSAKEADLASKAGK